MKCDLLAPEKSEQRKNIESAIGRKITKDDVGQDIENLPEKTVIEVMKILSEGRTAGSINLLAILYVYYVTQSELGKASNLVSDIRDDLYK